MVKKIGKIFKYLFWIWLLYIVIKSILIQLCDRRAFIFENYKSSRTVDAAIQEYFSSGTTMEEVLAELKRLGCSNFFETGCGDGAERCAMRGNTLYCDYYSKYLFRWPPYPHYNIIMTRDKDHRLVSIRAYKVIGLVYGS